MSSMQNKSFGYIRIPVLFLMALYMISCQSPDKKPYIPENAKLGELELRVSGDSIAQKHFKNGLLLLHSFEYLAARSEFLQAQAIDKDFLMAYWGECMAYNHTIWQRQLTEYGREALRRLGPTREVRTKLAKTEIEKDFLEGVEILFAKGTKAERDLAYMDHMEEMVKKYPDNHEVLAFYAVALLGSSKNGRDEELFDKSAKITQGILDENPNHPGALHYLIHSYDDPDHAHLAVDAAYNYAVVAPDAAHALHMPSHIYVALGRWNDVVNSNIASWNASVRSKQAGLKAEGSYHSFHWLQYGLLQRGEIETATRLVHQMKQYAEENPSRTARAYLLAMQGAHLVNADTWPDEIANIEVEVNDLAYTKRSQQAFIAGMNAVKANDKAQLKQIIIDLKKDKYNMNLDVGNESYAMCYSGDYSRRPPNQLDIDLITVMQMELEAELARLQGQNQKALQLLAEAASLDEGLKYAYGPPVIMKPVHELYAEYLLAENRYEEAFDMYTKALERQPLRRLSLEGKVALAKQLGKTEALAKYSSILEGITKNQPRDEIL